MDGPEPGASTKPARSAVPQWWQPVAAASPPGPAPVRLTRTASPAAEAGPAVTPDEESAAGFQPVPEAGPDPPARPGRTDSGPERSRLRPQLDGRECPIQPVLSAAPADAFGAGSLSGRRGSTLVNSG